MVHFPILNAVAIAAILLGAEAGPCKPKSTAITSLAETSSLETSSTIASYTTTTHLDTTTVTSHAETTTTATFDTTTASTAVDATTTTETESTTTSAAPACVETELFINPGFDNSDVSISPWISNGIISQDHPQSGPNALALFLEDTQNSQSARQTLSSLNGDYLFSYFYKVVGTDIGADYVCAFYLTVGSQEIRGDMDYTVGGWKSSQISYTQEEAVEQTDVGIKITCSGDFAEVQVNIDSLSFTRVCSA
ncbi:hypothetical protein BFJ68_g1159 [Fusarium oxysporum]|uniref:CBM-cenC domain-containing protein n=1 Tax=Fusarium oxysporum TaxID=5507 RepID=A0A420S128_FUSOX|nr:hypothetical protein BFJ68_g1159 [Fusarium oxysporum]